MTDGGTVRPVSRLVTQTLRPFVATGRSRVGDCCVCVWVFLADCCVVQNYPVLKATHGEAVGKTTNNNKTALFKIIQVFTVIITGIVVIGSVYNFVFSLCAV